MTSRLGLGQNPDWRDWITVQEVLEQMLNHDIIATPPVGLANAAEARPAPTDLLAWARRLAQSNVTRARWLGLLGLTKMAFGLCFPWLLRWASQHQLLSPNSRPLRTSEILLVVAVFTLSGAYLAGRAWLFQIIARRQVAALTQPQPTTGSGYATD